MPSQRLEGPNSLFPLAWMSKRQTSVSRSIMESKIDSLLSPLALPRGRPGIVSVVAATWSS